MSDEKNSLIARTLEPVIETWHGDKNLWETFLTTGETLPRKFHTDPSAHIALLNYITSPAMDERFPGWRIQRTESGDNLGRAGQRVTIETYGRQNGLFHGIAPDHMTAFRDGCYELCKAIREEALNA